MSPHGIAGPPNRSSQNSGTKCPLARPIKVSNFIMVGQTMYKESITKNVYTLQYFGATGVPQGQSWPIQH